MRGAIFDVDGTLLDSMGTWHGCGARYLKTLGIEAEPELGDYLFTQTNETGAVYIAEHYGLNVGTDEIVDGLNREMERFYFEEAEPKAGAVELLEQMEDEGISMTVASSTDRYLLERAFERLGIGHFFAAVLTCDEVGATKADPLIFNEAAEIMSTCPEDTWVFEDGLYAIKTAHDAGFRTAAVYDEISGRDWEDMKKLADVHVNDLREFRLSNHII